MSDFIVDIIGIGKYLGMLEQPNSIVAKNLNISEEEIIEKSGIKNRFVAKDESATDMAINSLDEALSDANISKDQLDGIIVCTFSGDYLFPSEATRICKYLKINPSFAYDIKANCAGFQVGLSAGRDTLLANDRYRYLAIIGLTKQSPYINKYDINSAFYFGDASSSVIIEKKKGKDVGILSTYQEISSDNHELVRLRAGGSSFPFSKELIKEKDNPSLYFEHAGLGVWKEVIVKLPQLIKYALEDLDWDINDLSLFLMHQANMNLIDYIVKKLRFPLDKTITNVQDIGNTGDASVGTILYDAKKKGLLKENSKIILASVGAGFVYAVTPYIVSND